MFKSSWASETWEDLLRASREKQLDMKLAGPVVAGRHLITKAILRTKLTH